MYKRLYYTIAQSWGKLQQENCSGDKKQGEIRVDKGALLCYTDWALESA